MRFRSWEYTTGNRSLRSVLNAYMEPAEAVQQPKMTDRAREKFRSVLEVYRGGKSNE